MTVFADLVVVFCRYLAQIRLNFSAASGKRLANHAGKGPGNTVIFTKTEKNTREKLRNLEF